MRTCVLKAANPDKIRRRCASLPEHSKVNTDSNPGPATISGLTSERLSGPFSRSHLTLEYHWFCYIRLKEPRSESFDLSNRRNSVSARQQVSLKDGSQARSYRSREHSVYKTSLCKISNNNLVSLTATSLGSRESALQQWIWDDPSLLGEPLALLGREVRTAYNKKIDLLAIDEHKNVCVVELKRDKTPRDVIAQALDYASWIAELEWSALD